MTRLVVLLFLVSACSVDVGADVEVAGLGAQTNLPSGGTGCSIDEETGVCRCTSSPIVVDLAGDGIHLTGPDDGVVFQLRAGKSWLWSWTAADSDDAWLVLDADGNGRIDSGSEMFGDGAIQAITGAMPNGFLALAFYDASSQGGNDDGRIDSGDAVWSRLRLWRDIDHDGVSRPVELISLDKAGLHSLSLTYASSSVVDEHGNQFLFSGTITADAPVSATIYDVWLQASRVLVPTPRPDGRASNDYDLTSCKAWAYALANGSDPIAYEGLHIPCNIPSTFGAPVIDFRPGHMPPRTYLATMVVRYATSTSYSTALDSAVQSVAWAINPAVGEQCIRTYSQPAADPNGFGPYVNENPWATCTTQRIIDPPPSTGGC